MIIRAKELETVDGRTHYPVEGKQQALAHFVSRVTTPDNPFGPHEHEGEEFWFILSGRAIVSIDGEESDVEAGDLVLLASGTGHGLRSEREAVWLCFG